MRESDVGTCESDRLTMARTCERPIVDDVCLQEATDEVKTRLVCLDGAIVDLGHGGKLESQVLGYEHKHAGHGDASIVMWM
jgi:hypothetical protein